MIKKILKNIYIYTLIFIKKILIKLMIKLKYFY